MTETIENMSSQFIVSDKNKHFRLESSSETQGLLVASMRYFRASDIFGAKVSFKGGRARGHFSLPNEFQKRSKTVPLIGDIS